MAVLDDFPNDLLMFLTEHERGLINTYSEKVLDLISGKTLPSSEKQRSLLRVHYRMQEPSSSFEWAWLRFDVLRKIKNQRGQQDDLLKSSDSLVAKCKILEIENSQLKSEGEALQKQIDLLNEKFKKSVLLREEKISEISIFKYKAKMDAEELQRKSDSLVAELGSCYKKIRDYEIRLGLDFSVPEKFDPEIIKKSSPEVFDDELMNRCQACGRPISSCICSQ